VYPGYPNQQHINRQFPKVDAGLLHESANETRKLMKEVSIVLDRFATSTEFDKQVMTAAQASNMAEVKRLIKSIGITSDVDVQYNPDELRMVFTSKAANTECCKLTVALRWR
jgi:hypothetical protein